jgi:hypothetical protein
MKTFKEFLEEAYLVEMQKQDKVAGKERTPLYLTSPPRGRVGRDPEGNLETRHFAPRTVVHPAAFGSRHKQGMLDPKTQPYATRMPGAARHAHGGGGSGAAAPGRLRGVGKIGQQKMDKERRDRGERPTGSGLSPAKKVEWKRAQQKRSMGGGR